MPTHESANATPPTSATPAAVAWAGLLGFLCATVIVVFGRPFVHVVHSALFIIGLTASAIFFVDTLIYGRHRQASTGLEWSQWTPSIRRAAVKFAGLLLSIGFIALLYWLLPEYHSDFYDRYYAMLRLILPPWLGLALPYLYWLDGHMRDPHDAYWQMGRVAFLDWQNVRMQVIVNHLLGWVVKGFFLPLMFTFFCNDIVRLQAFDSASLTTFGAYFHLSYDLLFYADVGLVSMGYLMSLRLFDTHIRSAEPTLLGWAVALACYPPFWTLIGRQYLSYRTTTEWDVWLNDMPLLSSIWGCAILLLSAIYVWATVIFGARFSNLTHRGIITNGPYRWTKHPAYLSKNLSWWMISIPFVIVESVDEAVRHSLLLLILNGIYYLRAKTEERHLSRDPEYVKYVVWIENNGLFARQRRSTRTQLPSRQSPTDN